jgi:hypothetical protein
MKTLRFLTNYQYKIRFVKVYDYQSDQEITNSKIILNQNTFSFLIDGTKEVFF